MSSPSQLPNNSTTMSNPCKTSPAAKKEDYEDYDILLPKDSLKEWRDFDSAVSAIKNDFNKALRLEWENKEEHEEVTWFKKRDDGTEVELPSDLKRMLLFLYSRNFNKHVNKDLRKAEIKEMLEKGRSRKILLQVIQCSGDNSLSFDKEYQAHYIRACLTIHRYFQQTGATGFVPDMSSLTYYVRVQKFGTSCFLQAACVAISYLLQAHGQTVAPPNASRLIRHHFYDNQLINYIMRDYGGDSVGIFKILEKQFFTCHNSNPDPTPIISRDLHNECLYNAAITLLKQGPGLVSKFRVSENFMCSPPSSDLKEKWPELSPFENWDDIPTRSTPPGVARFTTWDEPAEFIPLIAPSDSRVKEKECDLKNNWEALLFQSAKDDKRSTSVTASMSADSSSCLGDNGCQGTPSERSTDGNDPMFKFKDWSHFLNDEDDDDDDNEEDDNLSASYEGNEPGEGADATPLHAMVLLGHRIVDESGYWLLQNSWEGPMQIIEVSTEYLVEAGAYLYFYGKKIRSLKPDHQWGTSSSFFCPSPVAESSQFERSDCEDWTDYLVHSVPQKPARDLDDILNDWFKEDDL